MTKTHNTNEQPNETKFKEATLQIYGSVLINKSWYPTLQQSEKDIQTLDEMCNQHQQLKCHHPSNSKHSF